MDTHHELPSSGRTPSHKRPFDLDEMFSRIEDAIESYPPPLLHQLHGKGFTTPFELIVGALLWARTPDEIALAAATQLFARARAPRDVARLAVEDLCELISAVTYARQKAEHIHEIAEVVWSKYEGRLPCRERILKSLRGVGSRCANLVLGIACEIPKISVDQNVQRVTTRWGYIVPSSVSAAETQLCEKLPKEYWLKLNQDIETFGKHICTKERPHCSTCPVLEFCRQVGVENPR